MSKKGVQNKLNNGGAHVDTHEASLDLKNCSVTDDSTDKASLWEHLGVAEDSQLIQDGGAGDVIVRGAAFEQFQFDPGPLAGLGGQSGVGADVTDDDDGGLTGLMVANFPAPDPAMAGIGEPADEWVACVNGVVIKSEFPIADHIHDPDDDSPPHHAIGMGVVNKVDPDDVPQPPGDAELGELFPITDDTSVSIPADMAFSLVEGLSLTSTAPRVTTPQPGPGSSGSSGMLRFTSGSGICHSSPVSPISFLEEPAIAPRSRSYSDTEPDEKVETKAFLEELERGSQLTAEDKELMEMSQKELQAYEFQVFEQDKSNTLLSARELESLPVQGLEFEEPTPALEEESVFNLSTSAADCSDTAKNIVSDNFSTMIGSSAEIVQSSMSFISVNTDQADSTQKKKRPTSTTTVTQKAHKSKDKTPKATTTTTTSVKSAANSRSAGVSKKVSRAGSVSQKLSTLTNKKAPETVSVPTGEKKPTVKKAVSKTILKKIPKSKATSVKQVTPPVVQTPSSNHQKVVKNVQVAATEPANNMTQLVMTNNFEQEQIFQVAPSGSELVPVQMSNPSTFAIQPTAVNKGVGAATASGDAGTVGLLGSVPGSNGDLKFTAVPILYVKDGCLVIPIQQIESLSDQSLGAACSEGTTAAALLAASSAAGSVDGARVLEQAAPSSIVSVTPSTPPAKIIHKSPAAKPKETANKSHMDNTLKNNVNTSTNNKNKRLSSGSVHLRKGGEKKSWECTMCQAKFPRLYKLRLHIMKHTGEKPFKCNFPECTWAFTTAFKLKRHLECHQGRKEYVCDFPDCGKKFTTIYNLKAHTKSHKRRCTIVCPTCDEKFSTQRQLDYHMRANRHGNTELTYECPHEGCRRKFFSRYCMGSHMRVHLHSQSYPCPEEGCDRLFDKQCRLQQHLRSHTGEKPYHCTAPGCGAAFGTQSKLKRHARKHTGERRWVCEVEGCGKAFMRAEHLRAHSVTHTGEKPFECKIPDCNARFKCKSSLYVHLKRHAENAKKLEDPSYASKAAERKKYGNKAALGTKNNYNKQLQNALGDLFTLINAEDLEYLINSQVDQQVASADASVSSSQSYLNTVNTSTLVNPTDILSVNLDGQPTIITNLPQSLPNNFIAHQGSGGTSLLANTSLVPTDLLFETAGVNLVQDKANSIININAVKNGQKVATNRVQAKGRPLSRADNSTLKNKRKKQTPTDNNTPLDLSILKDLPGNVQLDNSVSSAASTVSHTLESTYLQSEDITVTSTVVNPNDIVTSRAITFRDPETGAIYVQTQLLQDDPPNPDIYNEDVVSLDPMEAAGLGSEPVSMTLDPASLVGHTESPVVGVSEYASTTINFQDLE